MQQGGGSGLPKLPADHPPPQPPAKHPSACCANNCRCACFEETPTCQQQLKHLLLKGTMHKTKKSDEQNSEVVVQKTKKGEEGGGVGTPGVPVTNIIVVPTLLL